MEAETLPEALVRLSKDHGFDKLSFRIALARFYFIKPPRTDYWIEAPNAYFMAEQLPDHVYAFLFGSGLFRRQVATGA